MEVDRYIQARCAARADTSYWGLYQEIFDFAFISVAAIYPTTIQHSALDGSSCKWRSARKKPICTFQATKTRKRQAWLFAKAVNDSDEKHPLKYPRLLDVDCSRRSCRCSHGAVAHTLTATRGRAGGFFSIEHGRRQNEVEFGWMQGITYVLDYKDVCESVGFSKAKWGHAMGDSLSLNVIERVLRSALVATGKSPLKAIDRWADFRVKTVCPKR